jgi:hypothetical protein
MDRFTKMWAAQNSNSNSSQASPSTNPEFVVNQRSSTAAAVVQRVEEEVIDLSNLPADPAQRRPIWQFKTAKIRDDVRRSYLQKGPFQPKNHSFPQTDMSGIPRRFISAWFSKYSGWLEYSIDEDAVYCLCCYLFQNESLGHGGGDAFSSKGWRLWNKASRLDVHVGGPSSAHNQNMKRCDDLMNQNQSISAAILKQTKKSKREYRIRLIASIDIARLLLCLGLPFRGHDESESSLRKGNFLTFYEWYVARCPEVAVVALGNAPKNWAKKSR